MAIVVKRTGEVGQMSCCVEYKANEWYMRTGKTEGGGVYEEHEFYLRQLRNPAGSFRHVYQHHK